MEVEPALRVLREVELRLDDFQALAEVRLREVTRFAGGARSAERHGVLGRAGHEARKFPFTADGIAAATSTLGGASSNLRLIAPKGDLVEQALRDRRVGEWVDAPAELPAGWAGLLVRRGGGPHVLRVHDDLTLTWRRERAGDPPHSGAARVFLTISGSILLHLYGRVAVLTIPVAGPLAAPPPSQ